MRVYKSDKWVHEVFKKGKKVAVITFASGYSHINSDTFYMRLEGEPTDVVITLLLLALKRHLKGKKPLWTRNS